MKTNKKLSCPICSQELDGDYCKGCESETGNIAPQDLPEWAIQEALFATTCLICNGTGVYGTAGLKCPCQRRTQ
ncbi:MAG: hypothetical protein ACP5N7_00890 [Candidatus Pacearchaeota archaeon]